MPAKQNFLLHKPLSIVSKVHKGKVLLIILLLLTSFCFNCLASENRVSPTVKAVAKVLPSVVNISIRHDHPLPLIDYFAYNASKFFKINLQQILVNRSNTYSLGSGIIINSNGLILTNAHTVKQAQNIKIILQNGYIFAAKLIACSSRNDLALLKISNLHIKLKAIKFATPGDLLLGETLIILGNPFGLAGSISRGILSATGRNIVKTGKTILRGLLQTDAAIHPGNSGGPVINIDGQMIGIASAVLKRAQNIGFVIPVQKIQNVLAQWLTPEHFQSVALGFIPEVKCLANGKLRFFIRSVRRDSPAWQAGLRSNMTLLAINGKKIDSLTQILNILWRLNTTQALTVKTPKASYSVYPQRIAKISTHQQAEIKLGIAVQPLNRTLAQLLKLPITEGILISKVISQSLKSIERGDLLLELGDFPINSLQDLNQALKHFSYGDSVLATFLKFQRNNNKYKVLKKSVILPVQ